LCTVQTLKLTHTLSSNAEGLVEDLQSQLDAQTRTNKRIVTRLEDCEAQIVEQTAEAS
jgi:hypothetical protein